MSMIATSLQLHMSTLRMSAGDAIRPFLLHAYGGLYMDVDVECFDATDDMVDGYDLVSMPCQLRWCCLVIFRICWQCTAPCVLLELPTGRIFCDGLAPAVMRVSVYEKAEDELSRIGCAVSTGASAGRQWQQVSQQCSHGRSSRPGYLGYYAAPTEGQVGSPDLIPLTHAPEMTSGHGGPYAMHASLQAAKSSQSLAEAETETGKPGDSVPAQPASCDACCARCAGRLTWWRCTTRLARSGTCRTRCSSPRGPGCCGTPSRPRPRSPGSWLWGTRGSMRSVAPASWCTLWGSGALARNAHLAHAGKAAGRSHCAIVHQEPLQRSLVV